MARQFQEQSMAGKGVRPGGEVQDNWDEWVAYLERLDGYAFSDHDQDQQGSVSLAGRAVAASG